jgi:P27 family predicted phage terminase small subunit
MTPDDRLREVAAIFAAGLLRLRAGTALLTNTGQNPDAEIVSILARIALRFRQKPCSVSTRITCLKRHAEIIPHNSNTGPFVEETPMCSQADPTKTHHLSSSLSSERAVISDCPDYLDAVGKAKWIELCEVLSDMGLLSEADRDLMAMYCSSFSQWREADNMVKKSGLIIKTGGSVGPNPCVEIAAKAKKEILDYSALLGLDQRAAVDSA